MLYLYIEISQIDKIKDHEKVLLRRKGNHGTESEGDNRSKRRIHEE